MTLVKRSLKWLVTGSLAKLTSLSAFLIAVPLVLSFLLASLGLPVMGFGWLNPEEAPPPVLAKPSGAKVTFADTPAAAVMNETFNQLDRQWKPTSTVVTAAGLPYALSCVVPAPALSESKSYAVDGVEAQVTFAAWPAGLGGEMYSRFVNDVPTCKPSESYVYTYGVTGIGIEASHSDVSWSVNNIDTVFFRRGDLLVFVATADGQDAEGKAMAIDQVLNSTLTDGVCPDQTLGVDAQVRNAFFSAKRFTGLVRRTKVEAEKLPRPNLPPALKTKGVEKLKGKGKAIPVTPVTLPSDDYAYPLWPELPTPVTISTVPTLPAKQKLQDFEGQRIPDPIGPGCGWAFLSTLEAAYDEEAVAAKNKVILRAAQEALDADGPRWQKETLRYWDQYHSYLASIANYESYRSEVRAVGAAWELIRQAWDAYYTAYANWQVKEAERLQFIADQKQAGLVFQTEKDECKVYPQQYADYEAERRQWKIVDYPQYQADNDQWKQDMADYNANYDALYAQYRADLKTWREGGRVGEKPQPPMPPKEPQPPIEPQPPALSHPCPPVRPAILDQEPPNPGPAPKPPPDPRPVGERD